MTSQRLVDDSVDVAAQGCRIHWSEAAQTRNEDLGAERWPLHGHEPRNRLPRTRDDDLLTGSDTVDHGATVVAQLTDRYFTHLFSVSHVIH